MIMSRKITVFCDKQLLQQILLKEKPNNWHNRLLYIGHEGGQAWHNLVNDSDYLNDRVFRTAIISAFDLCKDLPIDTYISVGPGDGLFDYHIIKKFLSSMKQLIYIPVDISDWLIYKSSLRLSTIVRLPFAILCDIESNFSFARELINTLDNKVNLFVMVGNTIGNFDISLDEFWLQISSNFLYDDYLLIGISVAKKWSFEADYRANINLHSESIKYFLSHGISMRTGEPTIHIMKNYSNIVESRLKVTRLAYYVEFYDKRYNTLITKIARFRFDEFLNSLKKFGLRSINFATIDINEQLCEIYCLIKKCRTSRCT